MPEMLLAKKPRKPGKPTERESLICHLDDVFSASRALIERAIPALESMGLNSALAEDLSRAVLRGAYLHDLGKANSHFQRALLPGKQPPQALRHEWVSTWLPIKFPQLDRWLFGDCKPEIRWAALFAVLGHHLKAENGTAISVREGSGETSVAVFCGHPDFHSCLKSACEKLGLSSELPKLPEIRIDLLDRPLGELRSWLVDANQWYRQVSAETQRFVALIKSLLIAADVAGSAVPKHGVDPGEWTTQVLGRLCEKEDMKNLTQTGLRNHTPRQFQIQVAETLSLVTFVKAGCGSGKTIAAYLWATKYATGRKLFFCYPTTGTATEGFRDYVIPSGEMLVSAELLHSRSECDLEDLLDTPENDFLDASIRIKSLAAWDVPFVICTVDQVLGLIQNSRKTLFSFPSIANGAFVFDEIHQYDDRLFGALLRFLEIFQGAPILLMTASLPNPRLKAISDVLNKRGAALEVIHGPAELEHLERYYLEGPLKSIPWDRVQETLNQGGKVLWVANTVKRCVLFAQEAKKRGLEPLIYHSRYRYCDRIEKHKAVIEAFKKSEPAFAVTTQVCEVSLDLSANLLVTDLAPVPALIQRMGRLNRRVTPENPGTAKSAIFLEPKFSLPYEPEELSLAQEWLQKLGCNPQSQAALAAAFEELAQDIEVPSVHSKWLDGGPFSEQASLREAGTAIAVIRPEDRDLCVDSKGRQVMKEITRHAIPMTLNQVAKELGNWKRLGFVFVVPEGRIKYSKEWGAEWVKK